MFYDLIEVLLLVCIGLVAYHYLLYPALIIGLARLRPATGRPPAASFAPRITLVIAAYNEEHVIAAKLRNTLALDYPSDRLEVIVVSDGSTDRTPEIASQFAAQGVISMHQPERRGKTAALNRAVGRASGEIIVFSDANNDFSPNALRELVKHFADQSIGGVCGVKRIKPSSERQASMGDSLYWKYESAIKLAEGRLRSITNADGEIFAMRRSLYRRVDEKIINDDAQLTIDIVRHGYRVIYEPAAQSHEYASISIGDDFFVKVRMVAGGFQTVKENWRFLLLPRSWFAFTFLSHKLLRWLIPELLIAILLLSVSLSAQSVYLALVLAQMLFYGTALYAYAVVRNGGAIPTIVYVPFYFCAMNLAALSGLHRYVSGWQTQNWRKAER